MYTHSFFRVFFFTVTDLCSTVNPSRHCGSAEEKFVSPLKRNKQAFTAIPQGLSKYNTKKWRNMEKTKNIKIKPNRWEGLNMGLTGNKIGSRSCAEGANRRRDALQFLLCCGFGSRKMENDEWSSEVLGSWKSKHNSAVGSPVGPLRLHWCNITLLMSSTTPSMILLFSLSSGFSLSLSPSLYFFSQNKGKEAAKLLLSSERNRRRWLAIGVRLNHQ